MSPIESNPYYRSCRWAEQQEKCIHECIIFLKLHNIPLNLIIKNRVRDIDVLDDEMISYTNYLNKIDAQGQPLPANRGKKHKLNNVM
jgi:hypothetical protein